MKAKSTGFTLIELVIVIIILSAIGIATSTYISTGVSIYTDVSERDKALNSTRFVMERLRRDVLNALPNSLVVSEANRCLTFTPVLYSSLYSYDLPIFPVEASTATITNIDNYAHTAGNKAVVYLLDPSELVGDKVHAIDGITTEQINFSDDDVSFSLGSPSKRLYIINTSKSYYFHYNNSNERFELVLADSCNATGSIMAKDIEGEFDVAKPTLQRNGLAKVTYMLNFDGQEVPIEQTLHVNNVP
jgi:MSHA biogenesis protein MshO